MTKRLIACAALALLALPIALASSTSAQVTLDRKGSACLPLPGQGTGKVRFFVHIVNHGSTKAHLRNDVHALWQRYDGSWKDSWLNTFEASGLTVGPHRGKTWYADFGADPSKPIIKCALRLGSSTRVLPIRVLR
jgi:hypothetical protein